MYGLEVYAVDNKHKSAELDSFVVSQLKNFQASWRMYDEFTHRKEFGLSDEYFYTIPCLRSLDNYTIRWGN